MYDNGDNDDKRRLLMKYFIVIIRVSLLEDISFHKENSISIHKSNAMTLIISDNLKHVFSCLLSKTCKSIYLFYMCSILQNSRGYNCASIIIFAFVFYFVQLINN